MKKGDEPIKEEIISQISSEVFLNIKCYKALYNRTKQLGKAYEIRYKECLCDLYTRGYMSNGLLCECSRRSLLYNLESVFPEKEFEVSLKESILRGGRECILHILVKG